MTCNAEDLLARVSVDGPHRAFAGILASLVPSRSLNVTGEMEMALKWTALGVLPNINMMSDVFAGEHMALVGFQDDRFLDALANGPNLQTFLSKFEGNHGQRLRPSLLVRSDAYPDRPNSEAISSFMDIVVACVVLDARVRAVTWRRNVGPFHTDAFEIYPWMIDPQGKRLVAGNAALWAIHELDKFRGAASAAVPVQDVGNEPAHPRFFKQLLALWKSRFIDGHNDWTSRAILRSLKMAASAMRLSSPTGSTESFYDYGRVLSLWVSAFEILVHPGATGKATRQRVLDLLKSIPWQSEMAREETHSADFGGGKTFDLRLANALYMKMNDLRNNFLHGNAVEPEDFRLKNGTLILSFPAAIFRMALATILGDPDGVTSEQVIAGEKTREEYGKHLQATRFRNDCEECLLAAVKPQTPDDE
ncbi:hypothetical protein pRL80097 (plasmid) [Rhizobium johnstonii 3841]|uniref:Apea-like HEPN domain-containing protein n=3 Tax=Rhizobium TaxID=379 RepID=Q1M9C2_RHIJ3|nr:hypothetical protein pRL80097 [Rhizobium johnstonii 3841]